MGEEYPLDVVLPNGSGAEKELRNRVNLREEVGEFDRDLDGDCDVDGDVKVGGGGNVKRGEVIGDTGGRGDVDSGEMKASLAVSTPTNGGGGIGGGERGSLSSCDPPLATSAAAAVSNAAAAATESSKDAKAVRHKSAAAVLSRFEVEVVEAGG